MVWLMLWLWCGAMVVWIRWWWYVWMLHRIRIGGASATTTLRIIVIHRVVVVVVVVVVVGAGRHLLVDQVAGASGRGHIVGQGFLGVKERVEGRCQQGGPGWLSWSRAHPERHGLQRGLGFDPRLVPLRLGTDPQSDVVGELGQAARLSEHLGLVAHRGGQGDVRQDQQRALVVLLGNGVQTTQGDGRVLHQGGLQRQQRTHRLLHVLVVAQPLRQRQVHHRGVGADAVVLASLRQSAVTVGIEGHGHTEQALAFAGAPTAPQIPAGDLLGLLGRVHQPLAPHAPQAEQNHPIDHAQAAPLVFGGTAATLHTLLQMHVDHFVPVGFFLLRTFARVTFVVHRLLVLFFLTDGYLHVQTAMSHYGLAERTSKFEYTVLVSKEL